MKSTMTDQLQSKHINSYHKLRFLLFLQRQPTLIGSHQEFAEWLYLGDIGLVAEIISDLMTAGLMCYSQGRYALKDDPDVRLLLDYLAEAFENPLTRPTLLDEVMNEEPPYLNYEVRHPDIQSEFELH